MNTALTLTAISLAFIHTVLGPDHYVPFIAMAKAGNWSKKKTFLVTVLSGLAHVLSSVVIGFIGLALTIELGKLEMFEGMRGSLAAWSFLSFGFLYMIWGIKRAFSKQEPAKKQNMGAWIVFTIFLLGPCEPLIPLLMWPAAGTSVLFSAFVAAVFSAVTLATMTTIVMLSSYGLSKISFKPMAKYAHAAAGSLIFACGFGMVFLGL